MRATAHGEAGNPATAVSTFSIQDYKPVIKIVSPEENQSLTGQEKILVNAFDPDRGNGDGDGIEKVIFEILSNGEVVFSGEDSEAPYSRELTTTELENGEYILRAMATSSPEYGGASSTIEKKIHISNNSPVIDVISPAVNETVNGIYPIKISANDPDVPTYSDNGIESLTVNLLKDDVVIDTREFEAPDYTWDLNTLELENGSYSLLIEAIGTIEAGNEQASDVVNFEILNRAPEIVITNIQEGAVLQGTFPIIATAFDMDEGSENGDGVENVEFQLLNGSTIITQNTVSNSPYTWNLQAKDIPNGTYTLKAIANSKQSAGGTSSSTQISVSVDNTISPDSEITIQENEMGFCGLDGTIDNNNEGFTGDGFSNTDNAAGKAINWKIEVQEKAAYTFTWRYANGSSARNGDLLINGETLAYNVAFPDTGSWTTWGNSSITVELETGKHEVSLAAISDGGLTNIDYMTVSGQNVIAANCIDIPEPDGDYLILQENTPGFCGVEGTIDSDNTGFTGEGFANTENVSESGIEWSVEIPVDGVYTFAWRYANGSSNRPGKLLIDGEEVLPNVDLSLTGDWTTWEETSSYDLELTAGTHIVRLEATGTSGLANIDYMMLTGDTLPVAGTCNLNSETTSLDLNEEDESIEVICSPIPVINNLNIKISESLDQTHTISLFDFTGKIVKTDQLIGSAHVIDMSGLMQGMYFVKITGPILNTTKSVVKK